ncbi:DUF748 domain-containing protein [Steroidobacter sp.]|uniref:DUF748 domain-containing protein n=1 Tax=Steroidobacter sp. TaxID=1978227 RepID=UPI001A581EEF|nr:DUF748 domain-containing protein [Steroidobacter sp.]MBL8271777.1 DUF748 domain-containing protein [Steroidobacter sp.]
MAKLPTRLAPLVALARLHWIALSAAAGALLLYALAGFLLVPHVARSQLSSYVTETLHRQLSVGEIRFNPFTFETSISQFALAEADGAPLLAFRHLYVNAELASLWRRAVVLKEVQLAAPGIDAVIAKDGTVNLGQLIPPSTEPESTEATPVSIGKLQVYEGRIGLTDHTLSRPFSAELTPVRFTLTDFKTDVDYNNAYDFAATTLAGERLAWSGGFTVQPLRSQGQFSIERLRMQTVDSYLYESVPFRLAAGEASIAGTYAFALNPELALDVTLPSLRVRGLVLAERDDRAEAPVKIGGVHAQGVTFSYGKRDVGVKRLDVTGAQIKVTQAADGSINLMQLFGDTAADDGKAASAGQPRAATDASSAAPDWLAHIDSINVTDAAITAEDRTVSPATRFDLAPLQLAVNGWSTAAAAKMQVDADVTINRSGKLLGKGTVQLEPLSADLAVDLAGFELPVLQPYLDSSTAMTLHSGKLAVKGDVSYAASPESAPPLKFRGEVQVAELRTTDRLVKRDFLKWRDLAISGIDFSQNPDKLTIDRIRAREPYALVVISQDGALNVTSVLNPGEVPPPAADGSKQAANATANATGSPPFPVRIKTVQVVNGSANFADYSIEPSFATGILSLNGTVTGLNSDLASRAKVKLDGKVDKYAPVEIAGEINLLSAALYTDLSMNFRNMELTTFNPYSGKFAGYNISKGKLSTELQYKVEERKLQAAHHIVVDNLEFGDKTDSKDAAPIPLKLAIALLKDRHGVIDVNLPVGGTLDDPKFRLGPIVWKAVLNLLTKVVTAPFTALGALFGGGEELAFVDFPAGSSELPAVEAEKLGKLAKALVERPQLKLNVPLTVVTSQDSEAIARTSLAAKLPASEEEVVDDAAKRKLVAAYEKAYREIVKSAPQYPPEVKTGKDGDVDAQFQFLQAALLTSLRPDDSALQALAHARARAVQDALLTNTELNPERVFITAERSEGKSQDANVRMEMKLE